MSNRNDEGLVILLILGGIIWALVYSGRWRPARTAFGTAFWMTDRLLRAWGMLGKKGLILGRTIAGAMIRMPRYCHVLLVGGTGSGKGVGLIIPNLLDYHSGSLVVFDTKGDLFATTAKRRERLGNHVIRLAPFNGGNAQLNPLDTIPADSPLLVDSAKAMAESLVVREGTESDPHWNNKAAQIITAVLVLVLLRCSGKERSLSSIQDIISDTLMLAASADKLREIGGIPGRLGSQIKALFDKDNMLTKEGSGVVSTASRHLAFLDSEMVARSMESSTFDLRSLLKPNVTLYLTIPPDQLEAQRGLLRCWISTLIRVIGSAGKEESGEVLFLLDEASALGSLAAIEECLVRGRSAGARLFLAYQSDAQVKTAFKDKPTLLYDNCSTQIYLGASSYETAERISNSLGTWTEVVDSFGKNTGGSRSADFNGGGGSNGVNWGSSLNYAQQARLLMMPSEILTMDQNYLIAFFQGLPGPILARRIKWYQDPAFNGTAKREYPNKDKIIWVLIVVLSIVLCLYALCVRMEPDNPW